MQKLNYQWTQEEALHYYELLLSTAHETRLTRMISILWGPALSVALMVMTTLMIAVYKRVTHSDELEGLL